MKESLMWEKLKSYFNNTEIFLQRIESGSTGLGIPDIYFATKKENGWLELKEIKILSKNINPDNIIKIPFREGQKGWILNHLKYDKNIFIIYTTKDNFWGIILGKFAIKSDLLWSEVSNPSKLKNIYLKETLSM